MKGDIDYDAFADDDAKKTVKVKNKVQDYDSCEASDDTFYGYIES